MSRLDYNEPENYLMEFIRSNIYELRRSGQSIKQIRVSETFSGDGSTTEFTVTNTKLLAVKEVTISSTKKYKFTDYYVDLRNNKIIFKTAPAQGTDNISIDYFYNSTATNSFCLTDKPRKILQTSDFPLIIITPLVKSSDPIGMSETSTWDTINIQFDIMAKKDMTVYINDGRGSTQIDTSAHPGGRTLNLTADY